MTNRFKGLILSLGLLLILNACVEQVPIQQADPIRLFNREYYAVKKLTRADVRKMKSLMESTDQSASKTAGLILGRHYVRNGELEKGYELLQINLDDSYLDRFTKVSGHLWLYDAASKLKAETVAEAQIQYLQDLEMDEKAEKAFRVYCNQEVMEIDEKDVKACVVGKIEQESAIDIEMIDTPDGVKSDVPQVLKDKLLINLTSAEKDTKLVEAMLYSISKLGVDIELDFAGDKEGYDFVVDIEKKSISKDGSVYSFNIDMGKNFEEAVNFAILNGGKNIAIGYTKELRVHAEMMVEKYSNDRLRLYMFEVTAPDFQQQLKTVKEMVGEEEAVSFAVVGTADELIKVVPFLRFYSEKPDRTIIVSAVDGFGKKFFSQQYIEYFRKSFVVADVLLLGNSYVEHFNEGFFNDFSRLPNLTDMLGHDIIVFLEKARNPNFEGGYLTGIKNLEEGKAARELNAYKIVTSTKIRQLNR